MVEQVGDGEEERGFAAIDRLVRDRRRDVRLAAAGDARQHQPALRVRGEASGHLDGLRVVMLGVALRRTALTEQRVEGEALHRAQPRVAHEPVATGAIFFRLHADARSRLPEIGMRRVRGDAHEARTLTVRTGRSVAGAISAPGASCAGRPGQTGRDRALLLQNLL